MTKNSEAKVIPFSRRERESQARMRGDRGDYFRTVEMEDMFRARAAEAFAKLGQR